MTTKWGTLTWRGRKNPVASTDPLVLQMVELLGNQPISRIAEKSGVHETTMHGWLKGHKPRLDLFNTALGALGHELYIRRRVK